MDLDPVVALVESWPDEALLSDMPIATNWKGTPKLERKVSVDAFAARARVARSHCYSWTLSSTMTDLCVNKNGEVEHAPFDPPGPGPIGCLHRRLTKVHQHVEPPSKVRIHCSLKGRSGRVEDNGLGFDQSRLGSFSDAVGKWVDPVVEVLAFFGLAVLPVRGYGIDRRFNPTARLEAKQRGWRKTPGGDNTTRFIWPAWRQPLDIAGIDALMDVWNPDRRNAKNAWSRLGIHAAWQSVKFQGTSRSDRTTAFGSERL